jgi:hypothetical protein
VSETCVEQKKWPIAIRLGVPHDEGMPFNRASLLALHDLLAAPPHEINERLQQKTGESLGRLLPELRLLQLLPDTFFDPRHSRDGIEDHGSTVDFGRASGVV